MNTETLRSRVFFTPDLPSYSLPFPCISAEELEELERGIDMAAAAGQSSHVEYAILDKAGRLQVPAAYLESIGARDTNKVKLELADGSIVLTLPEETSVTAEMKSPRTKSSHRNK